MITMGGRASVRGQAYSWGDFSKLKMTWTGTTLLLHLSKSVNGSDLNSNTDLQHNESKDEKGIEPLAANVVGIVEERAARSTRDAKGSRPAM